MKKVLFFLALSLVITYGALHVVLASSPVQHRILAEIRSALSAQGIDVSIESIDLSFFVPRIYLNRVTVTTNPEAEIQLEQPLEVDKVKIEFQPLGLLNREIVLDEVALIHPKIIIPAADKLYQKVVDQLEKRKRIEVKGSTWPLVFRRLGIVDSQFDVRSSKPSFSILSRSLTVFVSQTAVGQQSVETQSTHLELQRDQFSLVLEDLDGDLDFTEQSVRLNKLRIRGPGINLQWKGACSLPITQNNLLSSFHLSHETDLDLALLNTLKEMDGTTLEGRLQSSGTLHAAQESYSGSGELKLTQFAYQGHRVGDWDWNYLLTQKEVQLSRLRGVLGKGSIQSELLKIGLDKTKNIEGEIRLSSLEMQELFTGLQAEEVPLFGQLDGVIRVSGQWASPRRVQLKPALKLQDFLILNEKKLGRTTENEILFIKEVGINGSVEVENDGVKIVLQNRVLGGELVVQGSLGGAGGQLAFEGQQVSLDQLKQIAEVPFGGRAQLKGAVRIHKKDVNVEGEFDIVEASIADLMLGTVKGKVQYREDLLSFSRLELKALETGRGQGFVDFKPKETTYRFDINVPRIGMEQTLGLFKKVSLPVELPKGGELSTRVTISGGKDDLGIDVLVDGQARSFEWYGEKWMSAGFGFRYRPESFSVNRGVFLKRSGSLEVRAQYDKNQKQLAFHSSGLRLEDLDHLGKAPLKGEIAGRLIFEGDLDYPRGNGELMITKAQFREAKVPETKITLKTSGEQSQYWLDAPQNALKAHLTRKEVNNRILSRLNLTCKDTNFAPFVSAWLGKDINPLNGIVMSGEWTMEGDFSQSDTIQGKAQVNQLKLDFEGKPLASSETIRVIINQGGVQIQDFKLTGADNEISGGFTLIPQRSVQATFRGNLGVDFLQPFIPGLDYATGLVSFNIKASGAPESYTLNGNILLNDTTFRLTGMEDEFRSVNAQLGLEPRKLVMERFQGTLGGGEVVVGGDIDIGRLSKFSPNLTLFVSKVNLQTGGILKTKLTGDLRLRGKEAPYQLSGQVHVDEALLTSLQSPGGASATDGRPVLTFDIKADAKDKLFVKTEVINAEFGGEFHLVGDTHQLGLLGRTEVRKGQVFFKDTPFDIISGTARFERLTEIYPRFTINGRSIVREQKGRAYQDYEVNLQVLGTPDDYKIRLASNPPLVEQDLISLLVLGMTTRGQEGNYFDLGTAIMGQSPIKSKIQSELGLDIKVQSAPNQGNTMSQGASSGQGGTGVSGGGMVPAVRIEKGITRRTKLSYSNTLDQAQSRELRLEQMLDENITLNATAGDRSRNNTQARPGDAFGLDLRYRFSFE